MLFKVLTIFNMTYLRMKSVLLIFDEVQWMMLAKRKRKISERYSILKASEKNRIWGGAGKEKNMNTATAMMLVMLCIYKFNCLF